MHRPAGVILAAVVLGILALLGVAGAVVSIGATLLVHNPIIRNAPMVRLWVSVFGALVLVFYVWCGWAAAGLLRMRNWARISTAIIGGIIFLFSAGLGSALLVARGMAPAMPLGDSGLQMQTVIVATAVVYFLFSLIGVWWLVYFNLRPVREAFAAGNAAPPAAVQ
jgi:hypothetical protein